MDSSTRAQQSPNRAGRPTSGKRIQAGKNVSGTGGNSSVKRILQREVSARDNRRLARRSYEDKFGNFILKEEYDTFDPKAFSHHREAAVTFLRRRSKVVEIVAARDIIFVLNHSGACTAISLETGKRLCILNVNEEEIIRSLFFNKNNESIVTVSVFSADNFSSLKCRNTPLEYVRRGQPEAGLPLFQSDSLRWPGFVEFDDVNGKVLTYSAEKNTYKIFDLKNYNLLYTLEDKEITEIKISPGIMLLIYTRQTSSVPLRILNINDGSELLSFNQLLHKNTPLDFIEQFNEKLLVKQERDNLQIIDVRTLRKVEVINSEFMTPSAFIFLYENQLFLTFRHRQVTVWNFRGQVVTRFADHTLWYPDCNTNNIYITSDQDLIVSYCQDLAGVKDVGSINISNILTGKLVAKLSSDDPRLLEAPKPRNVSCSVREALDDITALFYDEERNQIYTGNRAGMLHIWSN